MPTAIIIVYTPSPYPQADLEPSVADLAATCTSGTAAPRTAPFKGLVSPYLTVYSTESGPRVVVNLGIGDQDYVPGILHAKNLPAIQMITCVTSQMDKTSRTCDYTGNVSIPIYTETLQVRVVAASTGKTLGSRTFTGTGSCDVIVPVPGPERFTESVNRSLVWDYVRSFAKK